MDDYRWSEEEFENKLIESLSTGFTSAGDVPKNLDFTKVFKSQLWDYRPDLKTTADLEQNFKEIIERNNKSKLDKPLSEGEFRQIMDRINEIKTPYEAARFLYGVNGVSQIDIDMDDGRHEYFRIFDQSQVGGGDTVYQVVNQIERPAVIPGRQNRRFDVTLLINGLPIFQIELKKASADVSEAIEQMKQYIEEDQYSGIFSLVQVLIAMTPSNTKYMAAATSDQFNPAFAFNWKDANNRNVRNWHYIADHMLSIPAAHMLATNYMILDGSKGNPSIKVMRPYQVQATRLAMDKIDTTDFDHKSVKEGYIWHTTGSGKTITSYKTAALASRSSNIDKVVFLVDRKSLTRQTLESYQAYDPDTYESESAKYTTILDTRNVHELYKLLKARNTNIIITSTQKMQRLIRNYKNELPDRKFLFIVDEAHRSTGSDIFYEIQKAFPRSAWLGYSGTPVFDEAKKGYRTVDVFGELLHAYTIREAIDDKNVLGFHVDFNNTVPVEENVEKIRDFYKTMNPSWSEERLDKEIDNLLKGDSENSVLGRVYDENPKHIEAVVKDVIANWENRSVQGKYNALFTTHASGGKPSIPLALAYYKKFKELNQERVKAGLPGLKIAVSVTRDDSNGQGMTEKNSELLEAIEDYNKMFGTSFGLDNIDLYNMDLEDRLSKNSTDGKFLDLVIVVDRLLTGFDAPGLNTLYVDRLLKGANLIQAYSRTNRVKDAQKPFGNVVNYRWPVLSEQLMKEALSVYADPKNADLGTGTEPGSIEPPITVVQKPFREVLEDTKKILAGIRRLTDDTERIPTNWEKQDELLDLFRKYNAQITKMKQYPHKVNEDGSVEGFDYGNPDELNYQLGSTPEEHQTIITDLTNQLKKAIAMRDGVNPSLIDLRVEHLKDVYIDYDYLTQLFEDLLNQVHDHKMKDALETKGKIDEFTNSLDDRHQAKQVNQAAEAIFVGTYPDESADLSYPYRLLSTKELLKNISNAQISFLDQEMLEFRKKWGLMKVVDSSTLRQIMANHEYGQKDLDNNGLLTEILTKATEQYKETALDEDVRNMSKFKYRNRLRDAILEKADEQVLD